MALARQASLRCVRRHAWSTLPALARPFSTSVATLRGPLQTGTKFSKNWPPPSQHFGKIKRLDGNGRNAPKGKGSGKSRGPSTLRVPGPTPIPKLRPEFLPRILDGRIDEWVKSHRLNYKLRDYGFTEEEAAECLNQWAIAVRKSFSADRGSKPVLTYLDDLGWDTQVLTLAYESGTWGEVFESVFLRHFLWTASQSGPERLRTHLGAILKATDISEFAQSKLGARSLNRKFHLHMGPTNSGKTYNALKALSKADSGVYAGPLRLLAHEVWERLNLGSVGELNGEGRACNLVTGEERRIVSSDAGLVSCTVEMLPLDGNRSDPWDVVVIDEIQMMGDQQRGGAWTNAVMGVKAKEIHLCGDETTAELLKTMIKDFKGDTLTIHKYERLTPLKVADDSLKDSWKNVSAGDCIVTFSRSNVFAVKKMVEKTLGKKAAVVYGALPPETRAEQARDFNEGRAEVLVASDAVGMGLNLKINRIIFESLVKFDGRKEVPLSLSMVKQIAGRAGRFGQQRTASNSPVPSATSAVTDEVPTPGGSVTTLHEADLPLLRAMLPLSLPPVTRAVIEAPPEALDDLAPLLPPNTPYEDLIEHFQALAKLPPKTVLSDTKSKVQISLIVEPFRNVLTLKELQVMTMAPVSTRDDKVTTIFSNMVKQYADRFLVDLEDVFHSSGLLQTLENVEDTVAHLPPVGAPGDNLGTGILALSIPKLESLHKSLVIYLWLSFRFELAFPDRELAAQYKERTEKMLEICLERLPMAKTQRKQKRKEEPIPELDADLESTPGLETKKGKVKWTPPHAAQTEANKRKWQGVALIDERKGNRK